MKPWEPGLRLYGSDDGSVTAEFAAPPFEANLDALMGWRLAFELVTAAVGVRGETDVQWEDL